MSWYKEYKEEWTEIIETVAAEEHRQTQMIEKDTIQSMILFKERIYQDMWMISMRHRETR